MGNAGIPHKKLGWFLCWAVVFADIGTSLYYVPGILYGDVRGQAGLFVMLTSIVFVLLTLKYVEITERYAEGGGVVTVASHAFGPWFGALGGMFITVDYFLTASISSVSGFSYLNSIVPIGQLIVPLSIVGMLLLGALNVIGIKESARFSAIVALLALAVDLVLLLAVGSQLHPGAWKDVLQGMFDVRGVDRRHLLSGFAGAFLAFSGLESISQISPAMAVPRRKVAGWAMGFVVLTILLTSPLLTAFSTRLLTARAVHGNETILESVSRVPERTRQLETEADPAKRQELRQLIDDGTAYSSRFISELGAQYGGNLLKFAVVITASVLLLFAANTAIIGAYHVFIALSRNNFFPRILELHNVRFDTPHYSILLAVVAPIVIILATAGNVDTLGSLYAFGLLGAFGLSSLGLDVVRWREGQRRQPLFLVGLLTTALVFLAWVVNLYSKVNATVFGGTITVLGMIVAYVIHTYYPRETHAPVWLANPEELARGQVLVPLFNELDPGFITFVAD